MFDLEKAVAEWRQQMLDAGVTSPAPLDELESHLREDVEERVHAGLDEPSAFQAAARQVGTPSLLKAEFKKLNHPLQILQLRYTGLWLVVPLVSCGIVFRQAPAVAMIYGVLLVGLLVASLVDFKSLSIPDPITIGGILVGALCSSLVPTLHGKQVLSDGLIQSLLGIGVGAGLLYALLRIGKWAFGQQRLVLGPEARIAFTGTGLVLPGQTISYEEMFYRKSDALKIHGREVKLAGRSYRDVPIRLTPASLQVGNDQFRPEEVAHLEAVATEIVIPREAMGLGDMKLMAAIGAFLGWQGALFTIAASSLIGSLVAGGLVAAGSRRWSTRIPYGPYLAAGATIWIFQGRQILNLLFAA